MQTRQKTGLVAVMDSGMTLNVRRSPHLDKHAVVLGQDAVRDLLSQKVAENRVRVLLPRSGSVVPLQALRRKAAANPLGFPIPAQVDNELCVLFGSAPDELGEALQQFDTIYLVKDGGAEAFQVVNPGAEAEIPQPAAVDA